ncbi:MAG TPA: histidine phosphatase family protein [Solirubrobacteraceae bacterium]|nr:histidine phosphatase family protein [Solirubrobacteraceae bacterium]
MALVRHAQTQWSATGRHTGRTDIPLTDAGRDSARRLGPLLDQRFKAVERVWSSPLSRARETCELCGLGARCQERPELMEWDYGAYEGLTTPEIREQRPGWSLWRDGCPDGEDAAAVGARVDVLISDLRALKATTVVFAHGHVLRVLAARWIGLGPEAGALLGLSTGSLGQLGLERETPVIWRWNETTPAGATG